MTRWFFRFARPYVGAYALGLLFLLATNALSVGIPWLLREAIHSLERGEGSGPVAACAGGIVVLAIAQAWVRTLSRLKILGASRGIVCDIRERFFAKLQRLDAAYYDRQRTGDIMSRGVNDLQLLQSFYGPALMNLLNAAIVYAVVLAFLFSIDARLTLVALALFPALFVGVNRLSKRVYARSLAVQEQLAAISNRAQENLSGAQQVKIHAQEEREIDAFRALCDEFRRRNLALARIRGAMIALIGLASGFGTLLVLYLGGRHVVEGRIGFGDFVAYNAYLALLAWPTVALGWIVNVFQRGAGAMARVEEVLGREPALPAPTPDDHPGPLDPVDGDIEIRGLRFTYAGADDPPSDAYSLRDVSLVIPRGSRVALVGPVGSGKSTLAGLIARVYPAPRGTVFIGGIDILDIPLPRLRRSVGYVPQEAFLFSRSLRENIALGRPGATDEEVARAVGLSHLEGDLDLLPAGLATVVGERGHTLSGGQRQRATLARAALVDPRILILDDSLSSIDADAERAVLEGLRERMGDRTCILISHRLSTVAWVDRIVVLDAGRVVEEGTHAELLARGGLYATLFRQSRLVERLDSQ